MFSRRQELEYAVLVVAWLTFSAYFWRWWLTPGQAGGPVLYVMTSICLFYGFTLLPSFYLFYLGWMRRPVHVDVDQVEKGVIGRVAVITLTVPGSEALSIVRRQLSAMRDLSYPHDDWVLVDRRHSPEIERLAGELGVRYFCRHDEGTWGATAVDRWNRPGPPFQSRTKSGNVNAWLDAHGAEYSHFTQLDIDHHPVPDYLQRVLGFFRNRRVAWVQAPSVYGNHEHWPARGSSEQEFVLQGPLQMGFFGFCRTPFIIGSHCTYDMDAVREIGGFQPTRAEDHLNTVRLAAMGYEGVFLPEVIAVGDGPESFDAYLEPAVRVGLLDDRGALPLHPPAHPSLHPPPGSAVPLRPDLVHVLVPGHAPALHHPAALARVKHSCLAGEPVAVPPAQLAGRAHRHRQLGLELDPGHHPHRLREPQLAIRGPAGCPLGHRSQGLHRGGARGQEALHDHGEGPQHDLGTSVSAVTPRAVFGLVLASLAACWWYLLTVGGSTTEGMLFFALEGALLFIMSSSGSCCTSTSGRSSPRA